MQRNGCIQYRWFLKVKFLDVYWSSKMFSHSHFDSNFSVLRIWTLPKGLGKKYEIPTTCLRLDNRFSSKKRIDRLCWVDTILKQEGLNWKKTKHRMHTNWNTYESIMKIKIKASADSIFPSNYVKLTEVLTRTRNICFRGNLGLGK